MNGVQAVVAILAAIGGVGGITQLIGAYRAYRDGVKQRQDEGEQRVIRRLEARVELLEAERAADAEYIRALIMALGMAGVPIPARGAGPGGG